jgi:hypothetical protein
MLQHLLHWSPLWVLSRQGFDELQEAAITLPFQGLRGK